MASTSVAYPGIDERQARGREAGKGRLRRVTTDGARQRAAPTPLRYSRSRTAPVSPISCRFATVG
jgi:hypothetical protein